MSASEPLAAAPGVPAERSDLLIEAYLDGTLTSDGAEILAGLIRAGGPQAAAIRSRLEFTGLLGQALDPADADGVARAVGERIDAEGESAAFARRVARALPARTRARRRRLGAPALAAAALVMLAFVGLWSMAQRPAAAAWHLIAAAPGSLILRAGSTIAAQADLALVPGDIVQAAGATTLRGADGSCLVLDAGARLTIEGVANGMRLRLQLGELEAEIAPQQLHHTFVLTTPQARVEVIGTRFTLDAAPARTRLDLAHGVVRLTRLSDGAALEMHADQTATVADGTALAAKALHPAATTTTVAAAGELPLFADGLSGWTQQHGSWSMDREGVHGNGGGGTARLLSRRPYGDLVLTCRMRIVEAAHAEVQVGDYNWFVTVPSASHQWIQLRVVEQGGVLSASADGVALAVEPGFGLAPRPGPLAFYVMRGRLEIADARIRTASAGAP